VDSVRNFAPGLPAQDKIILKSEFQPAASVMTPQRRQGGSELHQEAKARTWEALSCGSGWLGHAQGFGALPAGIGIERPAEKAMIARQTTEWMDEKQREKT
jgi:hypothetical protein